MRIFGWKIARDLPEPKGNVHVADVTGSRFAGFDRPQLTVRGFRPGMWVFDDSLGWSRAGILIGLTSDGEARVMLTQDDGSNLAEVRARAISLRQAKYEEVPLPRRTFPEGYAGYVSGEKRK